ncbi:unnamed protein product [Pleuronectes platessa]|uniref:Uncharacterized protein n=1 Tax=Pleuronectes platessa TaxID=8262 RepID=A0A9N7W0U7_PLEPL|nr:unnamed protein product [Pleuronectes platessa]
MRRHSACGAHTHQSELAETSRTASHSSGATHLQGAKRVTCTTTYNTTGACDLWCRPSCLGAFCARVKMQPGVRGDVQPELVGSPHAHRVTGLRCSQHKQTTVKTCTLLANIRSGVTDAARCAPRPAAEMWKEKRLNENSPVRPSLLPVSVCVDEPAVAACRSSVWILVPTAASSSPYKRRCCPTPHAPHAEPTPDLFVCRKTSTTV